MLPEKLRESYNGTMDSLYSILEDCLSSSISGSSESSEEDEEEYANRSNLVGVDDDDEDEEEAPAPSNTVKKAKPMFKSTKQKENSVKPMFRKKNKDDIPF